MGKKIFLVILIIIILTGVYGLLKPLPRGLQITGQVHAVPENNLQFYTDRTFVDGASNRISDQEIFDQVFKLISDADSYILIDLFFFSDFTGTATSSYRTLAAELAAALVAKKQSNPDITIQVITDPINEMYGGHSSSVFESLRIAGIPVIVTAVSPLRDSNPFYSAFWRSGLRFIPDWFGGDFLPNLLDSSKPDLSLRSYLESFNFKANHRKVVLTDHVRDGKVGFSTLLTSGNPHDGSSAHTNIALQIDSHIWRDVIESERAVAALSGAPFIDPHPDVVAAVSDSPGDIAIQLLTEGAIETKLLALLNKLESGDTLDVAMFYIADRTIIRALKNADERGVKIRLLLDPNKDAFGREKNGIPNRQVAHELMSHTSGNTQIRWCDTHGEQCHSKLLIFTQGSQTHIMQGSANLTRRNLDDFNLETNVYLGATTQTAIVKAHQLFFETSWENEPGRVYSTDYETYRDTSFVKTVRYRFGEVTGMSRW